MRVLTFVLAVFLAGMSWQAEGGNSQPKPKIKIKIQNPVGSESDAEPNVSIQNFSGWPLTIQLTMKNEQGIASTPAGFFPLDGNTGFVVFDDPDDCLVFAGYDWPAFSVQGFPAGPGCEFDANGFLTVGSADETYFEFSMDTDAAGVDDNLGNPAVKMALSDPASSGGQVLHFVSAVPPTTLGPATGDMADDGYGFGPDDDLPGLVVLAKHGPGIVYDTNTGIAAAPLRLRNLAGFVNAVSYELNSARSTTTIVAHMNVPNLLIAPVIIHDDNYVNDMDPDTVDIDVLWRVDGATNIVAAEDFLGEPPFIGTFNTYPAAVDEFRYEILVMAVSGIAPAEVMDMNGDNEIDETDLEAMQYTVLGKAKSFSFDLWPGQSCFGGTGNIVPADLDGDGNAESIAVCPTGPGSVSKPPR